MLLSPINIAIADDHVLFRKTLQNFLSEQKHMNVFLQASDAYELMAKLKHSSVDILLMNVLMPGLNGDDAVKMIRYEYPDIKILVLSTSTDLDLICNMLDSGIRGYISKTDDPEELLQAIHAVSENKLYRNKFLTEALYWNMQNNSKACQDGTPVVLSDREKKILQLIWEEKSNKEIADELFLGVRSVEKIRQLLKEKIGVRSTVGLIKYAIYNRIVKLNRAIPN